jgi:hypothetical protein
LRSFSRRPGLRHHPRLFEWIAIPTVPRLNGVFENSASDLPVLRTEIDGVPWIKDGLSLCGFFQRKYPAIQILRAIDALFDGFETLFLFERKLREADPPKRVASVTGTLKGMSLAIATDVRRFAQEWDRAVGGLRSGSHEFNVNLVIKSPPQLEKLPATLERITKALRSP